MRYKKRVGWRGSETGAVIINGCRCGMTAMRSFIFVRGREGERATHREGGGLIDKPVCWGSWKLAKLCVRASEQLRYLSQWLLALLLMKTCIRTRTLNQAKEAGTSDIFLAEICRWSTQLKKPKKTKPFVHFLLQLYTPRSLVCTQICSLVS